MKQENIKEFKERSEHLEGLKSVLTKKQNEFETENQALILSIGEYENSCNEVKEIIKVEAIEEYNSSGEKKLLGGIGIRVLTKLKYELDNAMDWAEKNMPAAIIQSIDKKAFEGFAKDKELNFVIKEEQISVTFPKEIKL